jgi:pSer/pThr/pTyr-binding forkhead associated (FHA) protein/thioredoxin reductase/ferredoxin
MPLRLTFETGPLAGAHVVSSTRLIRLGRDPEQNDLVLATPTASRRHAVIERSLYGRYTLEIVGSGPSKINGDPLVQVAGRPTIHQLASGDRVELGGIVFEFAEAQVKLMCVSGKAAGRELVLDGPARIGSESDCDLVIDDSDVAPIHLEIESTVFGFKAVPRAATAFNGILAESRLLAHGDELALGDAMLRYVVAVSSEAKSRTIIAGSLSGMAGNAVGELVALAGTAKGARLPLADEQLILGTRADCTFALNDPLASAVHCAISKAGEQYIATDLGSSTGTFINGERITQGTALAPGDLLAIGEHVFEARLLGGVSQAVKSTTMFATLAREAFTGPKPRFVIDGRVLSQKRLVFGRAPSCDVVIDDVVASREHCVIEWEAGGFVAADKSTHGTYVDDKRLVRQPLPSSSVLRVASTLFRVSAAGEVCTIERTDAALAEAAVEVARDHASRTRAVHAGAPAAGASPMRTVFVVEPGQVEAEIAARKKDIKRGAPAWRPSSDLARDSSLRGVVVLALVGALALAGGTLALGSGRALVDHPLSIAHSSAAFAEHRSGTTLCAACHRAGARVDDSRCLGCHAGSTPSAPHHTLDCGRCHHEHEGPRPHEALGAHDACDGCHPAQHAREFSGEGAPQKLAAGPLPATAVGFVGVAPTDAAVIALHSAHSKATVGGRVVGIACTACHATASGGQLVDAKPGLACFRCHQGGDAAARACDRCHGREHAASAPAAPAAAGSMESAAGLPGTPTPGTSLVFAFGLLLVGCGPSLAFGAWVRARRGRRAAELVEQLRAHPAEVVKRLVHSINDSKCVGCGLCVQACPASVLELVEHKSRVVNFDSCIQCKRCENACAFDALRMHEADKPPPMIAMPSLDAYHETPVAGMFLIGQASGTPQVKNATNLGRAIVQRILQQGLQPGSGRALGCHVDVAIVGSGPAGLSAALTCIEAGLAYVVLEKEREFSWTIRNYYHKGKEVMAEPHDIDLEATLPHWDSSREELLGAWQELVHQNRVDIRYQSDVTNITKDGPRFSLMVQGAKGTPPAQLTAARVVLAIGTLGNPRKLGCPGDDLEKVKNSLVDPDEWQGRSILVVGGSDSAVEVVLALCKPERRNRVTFSTRGAKLEGIKPKNRKLLDDALAAGQFEMRHATTVGEVTATTVVLVHKADDRREQLPNDVVFGMIGGTPPQKWLQQIGVPYVDKPHSWSPPRTDVLAQQTAGGLVQLRRLPRRPLPAPRGRH